MDVLFNTEVKLATPAIRSVEEFCQKISSGSKFFVVRTNGYTKQPEGLAVYTCEGFSHSSSGDAQVHTAAAKDDDEDPMGSVIQVTELVAGINGGVWLEYEHAEAYFNLLRGMWEEMPSAIEQAAIAEEKQQLS